MKPGRTTAGIRAAEAAYRALLLTYPPSFRRRHGEEMVRVFGDAARARRARGGRSRLLAHLAGAALDVAVTAPAEWLAGRGERRASRLASFARELRWAARSLRRSPAFTAVAVLTVATGIGATTGIFVLVDGILLKPLPYPEPERLVVVEHTVPALDLAEAGLSDGTYLHYRDRSRSLEGLGAYLENVVNLAGEGTPERVRVALVSDGLLEMLGARAVVGRLFTEEEQAPFDPKVVVPVVLSHDLWVRQYGADPGVVGRTVELNAAPKRVVGVVEAGFGFPDPATDVWYPLGLEPAAAAVDGLYYGSVGRLAPGVSAEDAERELRGLVAELAEAYPGTAPPLLGPGGLTPVVRGLRDEVVGEARPVLWILLGSVVLVLIVACANVVNLLLVRAEQRHREVALRRAVGAGRGDVGRFALAEAALVSAGGAAAGLAVAGLGVPALLALAPDGLPRAHGLGLDGRALAFAAALAGVCALVFAAVPLLRHARAEVASTLTAGATGAAVGEGPRGRWLLVGSQVALALTLLVGAGLLVRSAARLATVDPGFDAGGVLTLEVALPFSPYPDHASRVRFWSGTLTAVRALPGVEAAGAVTSLPLTVVPPYYRAALEVEGGAAPWDSAPDVSYRFFAPGYFEAMGIRLLEGRLVQEGEDPAAGPVLLSGALARRIFPSGGAVGARLRPAGDGETRWSTVVGVVGDVRQESLAGGAAEVLYVPVLEEPVFGGAGPGSMSLVVRATVPPLSLTGAVRRAVLGVDPAMPIANVRTMERILDGSTARTRLTMVLLLLASGVALFLGAVGIWGVVAYAVGRRARELGIRLALGARPGQVTGMVVRQGAVAVAGGVAAGLVAASALTRFLRGLLFEVSPTDPLTFAGTAAFLAAVGILASWLPVRRVARRDLLAALREP